MARLLEQAPDLDAVFVANDLMALGALQVLAEAGRRVPADVAIVGFDATPLGASASPSITSVRQPIIEMGEALATRLLDTIEHGEPAEPVVMRTEIALHETA
jgi:DNA-binding LacI/PurR family transcriptional regulator